MNKPMYIRDRPRFFEQVGHHTGLISSISFQNSKYLLMLKKLPIFIMKTKKLLKYQCTKNILVF